MCIEGDRRGIREVEKEEGSEMKVEVRKCSRRLIEFCSNLVGRKGNRGILRVIRGVREYD